MGACWVGFMGTPGVKETVSYSQSLIMGWVVIPHKLADATPPFSNNDGIAVGALAMHGRGYRRDVRFGSDV
jgi:hypothetical protein